MSPQSVALSEELSLAQAGRKGDLAGLFAPRKETAKPLIGGNFLPALNGLVENAIIPALVPGRGRRKTNQRWR